MDLNINAVSTGGIAKGYFDYLRFSRQSSGQMPRQAQADLEAVYAGQYPSVTQRQGFEVSMGSPHLHWFGGGISLPDYSGISGTYEDFLQGSLVPFIHDRTVWLATTTRMGPAAGSRWISRPRMSC